jgi:phage/plasmid primase-like uncharacterized protein
MSRYDIFKDIAGKSSVILDLLDIDQRARYTHVHCPMPSHDDRHPSFRVDKETERFYCTCTPRGGSMLDLVIAMQHANNFSTAARWLRKRLLGNNAIYKQVTVAPNFVTSSMSVKEVADRNEILRVLSHCVDVPLFHPYVLKKGILPLCAMYEPILKNLVLPIHDNEYQLQGIEYIDRHENKFCVDGTQKTGNGLIIGNLEESPVLGVAEGWSTAVSIHLALGGLPMLVTFGAANLGAAKNFAKAGQEVWFFADNDKVGLDSAKRAASMFGEAGFVLTSSLDDFNEDLLAMLEDSKFGRLREALHYERTKK